MPSLQELVAYDALGDPNPYGEEVELIGSPLETFVANGPKWINELRNSPNLNTSYRDFDVRGLLLAQLPDGKYYKYVAQNTKLAERIPKYCSEMFVISESYDSAERMKNMLDDQRAAIARAIGLYVLGTTNHRRIEEVTFAVTPTLHPCAPCRDNFLFEYIARGFIPPDMPVVTTGLLQKNEDPGQANLDVIEFHKASELTQRYEDLSTIDPENWPAAAEDPGFQGWSRRAAQFSLLIGGKAVRAGFQHTISPDVEYAIDAYPDGMDEVEVARYVITGAFSQPLFV